MLVVDGLRPRSEPGAGAAVRGGNPPVPPCPRDERQWSRSETALRPAGPRPSRRVPPRCCPPQPPTSSVGRRPGRWSVRRRLTPQCRLVARPPGSPCHPGGDPGSRRSSPSPCRRHRPPHRHPRSGRLLHRRSHPHHDAGSSWPCSAFFAAATSRSRCVSSSSSCHWGARSASTSRGPSYTSASRPRAGAGTPAPPSRVTSSGATPSPRPAGASFTTAGLRSTRRPIEWYANFVEPGARQRRRDRHQRFSGRLASLGDATAPENGTNAACRARRTRR